MLPHHRLPITILLAGAISAIGGCSREDAPTAMKEWPFDYPENSAAITMRQIVDGEEPILLVAHDGDDVPWQFIGITDANEDDGMIVCLSAMFAIDPSIAELADLPVGWQAEREAEGMDWRRFPAAPDVGAQEPQ